LIYDAIVLGLGGMGSATVYNLAKRGLRVLGIEQFNLGHNFGSSHGVNRIIRLAYAEDPRYVPLLRRSYELWRDLEYAAGERLLFITGGIDAGPSEGAIVRGSLASCKLHNLPHEVLTAAELHRRFPGYRYPRQLTAVYQQDGGFVLSERAILAYITVAQSLGAEIHAREPVVSWSVGRQQVVVQTAAEKYHAKRLVICAGSWASKLLPFLETSSLATPQRQVLLWTQPRHPERFQPGKFPVFNMEAAESGTMARYYGFPVFGVPGFKIGKYHHRNETVDPDRMNRECDGTDEDILRRAIRSYFPDADGPTMAMTTCLFTNSWDEHFVLDVHPEHPQVSVAAGFSGHGFKFCSVVGEIMADLAEYGSSSRFDLSLFRATRRRPAG
jgi:sarcosine oxidase